jgi:predicted transcriptional regulator
MKTNEDRPFAQRFECSVAEFAILEKAQSTNKVNVDSVMTSLPKGNVKIDRNTVSQCFDHLVEDGHLRKEGNEYTITDDGREDVQKLQPMVLELPQLVRGNAGQQRTGMAQQATTGTSGQAGSSRGNNPGPTNTGNAPARPGTNTGNNANQNR